LSDVTVAGNSLGGGVAWRLSLERPDLVERLLLLNAGGTTLVSELSSNLVTTLGTGVQRYATPRVAVRLLLRDAYGDPAKLTDDVLTRYHDLLLRRGNRAAVLELVRRYEQDHYDSERHDRGRRVLTPPSVGTPRPEVWDEHDIDDVPVPALFQWGTADSWLPTDFGRELASRIDDSRFVTYEGVGHVPMEEAPAETVADAAEFIE
jgi:pimeloyl-ACP methyl ester carboxylesterase